MAPFLPDASAKIMAAFSAEDLTWPENVAQSVETLAPGAPFTVPEVMFEKITDEQCETWKSAFSGRAD